jgi:exosortase/archaeosortase family protein
MALSWARRSTTTTVATYLVAVVLLMMASYAFLVPRQGSAIDGPVDAYQRFQARTVALVLGPLLPVRSRNDTLLVEGDPLIVGYACTGLDALIIYLSVLIPFPLHPTRKLLGIALGILLSVVINVLRISGLVIVYRIDRSAFTFAHVYLLPLVVVVAHILLFARVALVPRAAAAEKPAS